MVSISLFFILGILGSIFVGINIGGSSTGVAWGPSVGAKIINKTVAAALMTFFVFFGGWTIGRNVVNTLGERIIPGSVFTIEAIIIVLLFIGLGMLVANLYGVPVSTSMTAVGAVTGLGLATNTVNWGVVGRIAIWWVGSPVVGFWCGTIIGRYMYLYLDKKFAIKKSEGPLLVLNREGKIPIPKLGPGTETREVVSTFIVLIIACYMSFSAGASNVANAVAPLVGGGIIEADLAIFLGTLAIGIGAFSIARRTMESVGNDLTELPLLAAIIVMVVSASITTVASWLGVPISLALSTVMCIVGLGWGRASRPISLSEIEYKISKNSKESGIKNNVSSIGEENIENIENIVELFDTSSIVRFLAFWIISPTLATILSYITFSLIPIAGTP